MSDPGDPRPWEGPGAVRRDCEPHRGDHLALLGTVSVVLSAAGWVFSLLLPLVGIGLGVAVVVMARRDLAKMRSGLMDPAGECAVKAARRRSVWGIVLGLLAWVLCLSLLAALLMRHA